MLRTLTASAALLALAAAPALAQEGPQIAVADSEEFGQYLTDQEGRALYMFTADTRGAEGQEAQSSCYDACAEAWPPVTSEAEAQAAAGAQEDLLGTIQREDGTTQVTYNGWPLYYLVQDEEPGQASGQDMAGFGGEWYLVTPEGEQLAEETGG